MTFEGEHATSQTYRILICFVHFTFMCIGFHFIRLVNAYLRLSIYLVRSTLGYFIFHQDTNSPTLPLLLWLTDLDIVCFWVRSWCRQMKKGQIRIHNFKPILVKRSVWRQWGWSRVEVWCIEAILKIRAQTPPAKCSSLVQVRAPRLCEDMNARWGWPWAVCGVVVPSKV